MEWVMEVMRRIAALLLALVWALTLSACGGPAGQTVSAAPAAVTEAPERSGPPAASAPTESDPEETAPEASEPPAVPEETEEVCDSAPAVTEDGWYSSKEEVALYIHLYGHLPDNYITKREAEALGWSGGSVERYAGEGAAIGGSRFGNYEGLLPEKRGRTYTECDIDTVGASSRGAKRVVFSNDGLIYYTGDHYESFELLYGEP